MQKKYAANQRLLAVPTGAPVNEFSFKFCPPLVFTNGENLYSQPIKSNMKEKKYLTELNFRTKHLSFSQTARKTGISSFSWPMIYRKPAFSSFQSHSVIATISEGAQYKTELPHLNFTSGCRSVYDQTWYN